ncbi:MAG: NADH:ubiquinone oxidoreductase subunit NDUFA12 [Parvularculaceae bacterium]|nr:NADH:ubiquinone oxidoreductase subunit NDUFA12 [Parvularculaceae bacterium]
MGSINAPKLDRIGPDWIMLTQLFAWWDSTTYSTELTLLRRGARLVGRDEQGNRYYEERDPSGPDGYKRRWVKYHGVAEASRVTPDWHGWLHHTFDEPPTVAPLKRRAFEQDHLPNMTGTPLAYHPPGSLAQSGGPAAQRDYEAWSPES